MSAAETYAGVDFGPVAQRLLSIAQEHLSLREALLSIAEDAPLTDQLAFMVDWIDRLHPAHGPSELLAYCGGHRVHLTREFLDGLPESLAVGQLSVVLDLLDRSCCIHKDSPSGVGSTVGPVDASIGTVGDAAGTTDTPSGVSADPSGGAS